MKIEIDLDAAITDEGISEGLCDTFDSACGYWGSMEERVGGYDVWGHDEDIEEGSERLLSNENLREAFARIVNERLCSEYIRSYFLEALFQQDEPPSIDWGCIDVEAVDVWWQIAAFGKVVYG